MRDITFNMYFPMNYETNTFGMDLIIAVTSKSEPYFSKEKTAMNQSFLNFRTELESEANDFLIEFYQTLLRGKYVNCERVCTIKELSMEEEQMENNAEEQAEKI